MYSRVFCVRPCSSSIFEFVQPVNEWSGSLPFTGIDHHWKDEMFATSSGQLDVWSHHRYVSSIRSILAPLPRVGLKRPSLSVTQANPPCARTTPIHSFKWGSATIMTLRFCPADVRLRVNEPTSSHPLRSHATLDHRPTCWPVLPLTARQHCTICAAPAHCPR